MGLAYPCDGDVLSTALVIYHLLKFINFYVVTTESHPLVFGLAILNEKRGRVIDMFEPFFLLRVFLSFVIGGAVIGSMTILAQHLPQKTAGIILSLPITIGISLFFLWFISPQDEFVASFDIIPMGTSIVISFLVIYIYIAQIFKKRSTGIFFGLSSVSLYRTKSQNSG